MFFIQRCSVAAICVADVCENHSHCEAKSQLGKWHRTTSRRDSTEPAGFPRNSVTSQHGTPGQLTTVIG